MKRYLMGSFALILLNLIGCHETVKNKNTSISIEPLKSVQSIKIYLKNNIASIGFNGQPYCAYDVLGAEQTGERIQLYAWVICQEYYSSQQQIRQGTGSVVPIALEMQKEGNNFKFMSHRIPRDGRLYTEDLKAIFPKNIRTKIQSETTDNQNKRVRKLQKEIKHDLELRNISIKKRVSIANLPLDLFSHA